MPAAPAADEFDLFVSYAQLDNQGEHAGKVGALIETIQADYARMAGRPLDVFFDTAAIRSMEAWEHRILKGCGNRK